MIRALLNNGTDERKNFSYLEKILTKVSINCVVIVFFCVRAFTDQ